jgi:hypothetical protein
MDKKEAKAAFGGKLCGTYQVLTDNIARYLVGYRNGAKGGCFLKQTHLHVNYIVNDRNEVHEDGNLFYNWIIENTEGASAYTSFYYEGIKHFTNVLCASKGSSAKCRRGKLRKADEKLIFLSILVKNEGFWYFLRGKFDALFCICLRKIFFCNCRNGCRIGIKDTYNIPYSDVLIVSYV